MKYITYFSYLRLRMFWGVDDIDTPLSAASNEYREANSVMKGN